MVERYEKGGVIIKIAITGPESTGKSELSRKLANHYKTVWVPEYARGYIAKLERPYTLEDIENIAKGQIAAERSAEKQNRQIIFCDTELIVCKIWAEYKFGKCPNWIENKIRENNYTLVLLSDIDLPWQPDPQREHPDKRQFFFEWFERELKSNNTRFEVVSGLGKNRLLKAIQIIDRYTNSLINK